MAISFFETMGGELVDGDGRTHHVVLDIRCESASTSRFLAQGTARVTGTLRALPWADAAACEGTIEVRPVRDRLIRYVVTFQDADGTTWTLTGQKDIRAHDLVASMTLLHTELHRRGVRVACGTLRFDLNTLLHFLTSWRLTSSMRRLAPSAAPDASGRPDALVLSPRERETLRAVAETLIAEDGLVPAADEQTVRRAEALLASFPDEVFRLYRAALHALNAASLAQHQDAFARLALVERIALFDAADARGALTSGTVFLLGMPIKAAHFGRQEILDAIGVPRYESVAPERPPRWMQNHVAAESLPRHSVVACDVVVIGSGAGGGPVAATLAEAGMAVVVVEEGGYYTREQFQGPPEQRLTRFWRDGGMTVTVGNAPVVVPLGAMVGGSTAINSGTCYRTPDSVLRAWRDAGLPDDFEPDRFGHWLDRAESELGVAEAATQYLGRIADVVATGAAALGGDHGPLRRNAPSCDGQGVCVAGCPTGAKRSSDVSWIPRAMRAGARVFTGLPATRLLRVGRKCVGVVASGTDRFGRERTVELRAQAVVVACGTLHTPVFLANNGIRSPWLGRNLSVHPAAGAYARFAESLGEPWRAIPQGYRVDGLVDPRVRFEGFYVPPQIAVPTLPLGRTELSAWVNAWSHVGQYGFMVRDEGDGRVVRGPSGRPLAMYTVSRRTESLLRRGVAVLAEMLLLGGATEVATGVAGVGVVRDIDAARAIAARPLRARHFRIMGFHPLGTCRIGADPVQSVLDDQHRVRDVEGLYVADGSSIPTSLGVNPQVTIMAAALRCADGIIARGL